MAETTCPQCHKTISAADSAAFCPFCGAKLATGGPDLYAVYAEQNPMKKHELLLALQAEYPDSLDVAEEILHLGRLYDRGKRGVDFSIIKCYALNVYLEPKALHKDKREALRREIFHHPDLDKCLNLCDDQEVFLRRYLQRLSEDFIRLFLKGSTQHMHSFFGYINQSKAAKYLALPAAEMLQAMQRDETLTPAQRTLLMQAFYAGYAHQLNGDTSYLDAALQKYDIRLDTK
ncbi:MAG TPA: zinc ribbon domain-containing protein [Candidatus Limiplasma sp.]|nr:zinc ribbon domain-containing protein [Candidatus Limiplasma sp.]